MELRTIVGQLAGILSFVAFLPYIYFVYKKKIKPNIASWIIWTSINMLLLASYYAAGARETIWVPVAYVVEDCLILIFSVRNGHFSFSAFDKFCLVGAVLGIILWIITKNPVLALVLSLLIDLFGVFPTIRHSLLKPGEEFLLSWLLIVLSSLLNLFAITSWTFALSVYPLYMFFGNLAILISLLVGRRHVFKIQIIKNKNLIF